MSDADVKAYQARYYQQNRDKITRKRRDRYQNDAEYQEQVKTRALDRFRALRDVRLKTEPKKGHWKRGLNRPRLIRTGDKQVFVHGVGEFAKRITVNVQTITAWQKMKIIPPPTVIDEFGRRWYSSGYMDTVAQAVKEYHESRDRRLSKLREHVRQAWAERGKGA